MSTNCRWLIIFFILAAAPAFLALPQYAAAQGKRHGDKSAGTARAHKTAIIWTNDQGDWTDVPVFPPGAKMKVANGNPKTGPSDLYIKFPTGYGVPFHWHTPMESVYLQAGTLGLQMWKSEEKKAISAGSLFVAPPKMIHKASCTSKEDCYFFLHSTGPFDIHVVDASGKDVTPKAK